MPAPTGPHSLHPQLTLPEDQFRAELPRWSTCCLLHLPISIHLSSTLFTSDLSHACLTPPHPLLTLLSSQLPPAPHPQLTLPEDQYRAELPRLSTLLSAEHVRGVYEDGVPLELGAALQLGSVVKVQQGARSKSLAANWALQDFQVRG